MTYVSHLTIIAADVFSKMEIDSHPASRLRKLVRLSIVISIEPGVMVDLIADSCFTTELNLYSIGK